MVRLHHVSRQDRTTPDNPPRYDAFVVPALAVLIALVAGVVIFLVRAEPDDGG
jgi:hypothetical protein